MKVKTLTGIKVNNEARRQLKIIEGQGMASSESEVIEKAIHFLFAIMPNDKNWHKPLDLVVKEAIETIKAAQAVEENGGNNE